MRILVIVRPAPGGPVVAGGIKKQVRIHPEDLPALELALRMKEKMPEQEVCQVEILAWGREAKKLLQEGIWIGADQAWLWETTPNYRGRAREALTAAAIQQIGPFDLILQGMGGGLQKSERLAAALAMPCIQDVVDLERFHPDCVKITVDGPAFVYKLSGTLPLLLEAAVQANTARLPSYRRMVEQADPPIQEIHLAVEKEEEILAQVLAQVEAELAMGPADPGFPPAVSMKEEAGTRLDREKHQGETEVLVSLIGGLLQQLAIERPGEKDDLDS